MTGKPRQRERRQFSREFKLMAVARFGSAGNASALADELGVRREQLYKWSKALAAGGPEALRHPGRPRPVAGAAAALSVEQRVAELERELGRKEIELRFFKGALQRIEASRPASGEPGATASSRRSRR